MKNTFLFIQKVLLVTCAVNAVDQCFAVRFTKTTVNGKNYSGIEEQKKKEEELKNKQIEEQKKQDTELKNKQIEEQKKQEEELIKKQQEEERIKKEIEELVLGFDTIVKVHPNKKLNDDEFRKIHEFIEKAEARVTAHENNSNLAAAIKSLNETIIKAKGLLLPEGFDEKVAEKFFYEIEDLFTRDENKLEKKEVSEKKENEEKKKDESEKKETKKEWFVSRFLSFFIKKTTVTKNEQEKPDNKVSGNITPENNKNEKK